MHKKINLAVIKNSIHCIMKYEVYESFIANKSMALRCGDKMERDKQTQIKNVHKFIGIKV